MKQLNTLPQEVINKVKNTLKAYDTAYVIFENGEYHVSVGISLQASYAPDHEVIGTYKANEVFTEEERMVNYMESFHEYPGNYKGARDYKMLREIEGDWSVQFELKDGNLVRK